MAQSFTNFAQQGPWQGWAQGTGYTACSWTGVSCNTSDGSWQLNLTNRNLTGGKGRPRAPQHAHHVTHGRHTSHFVIAQAATQC